MLRLDGVTIAQDDFRLRADWSVPLGARVAVIGPSGAGKSTLLSVIAGFLAPTAGRVIWDGHDLAGTAPGARPLSILFQDQNLFPHLTLAQNLGLGLRPDLRLRQAEQQSVAKVLSRVGLEGMATKRIPKRVKREQDSCILVNNSSQRDIATSLVCGDSIMFEPGIC